MKHANRPENKPKVCAKLNKYKQKESGLKINAKTQKARTRAHAKPNNRHAISAKHRLDKQKTKNEAK